MGSDGISPISRLVSCSAAGAINCAGSQLLIETALATTLRALYIIGWKELVYRLNRAGTWYENKLAHHLNSTSNQYSLKVRWKKFSELDRLAIRFIIGKIYLF